MGRVSVEEWRSGVSLIYSVEGQCQESLEYRISPSLVCLEHIISPNLVVCLVYKIKARSVSEQHHLRGKCFKHRLNSQSHRTKGEGSNIYRNLMALNTMMRRMKVDLRPRKSHSLSSQQRE